MTTLSVPPLPNPYPTPTPTPRSYTPKQIQQTLTRADIVSTRVFELLPEYVRSGGDPLKALQSFFGAVQDEYDRHKNSITDVLMLVDPRGINNRFILRGNATFHHIEQLLPYTAATSTTITLNGTPPGVAGDDFYVGFGFYILIDNASDAPETQYRRVVDYDGTTKVATLDIPWTTLPTSGVLVLCFPDRIYLPVPIVSDPNRSDGTILPNQTSLTSTQVRLPAHFYISQADDYYNGWLLEFFDGPSAGIKKTIVDYTGSTLLLTVDSAYPTPAKPTFGNWFRLVPPDNSGISTSNDFYKDRWVRVVSGPSDKSYTYPIEVRKIIRSVYDATSVPAKHVAYVWDPQTREGRPFDFPPDPSTYIGISNHYVSLAYLARQLGYSLDALDPEELQREQIRQAFNFYKLKGTARAIDLICRTFGLSSSILEHASNYTHAPPRVAVGPGSDSPAHTQHPWSTVTPFIETGFGEDSVPSSYLMPPGRDTARIPDSDISIFLKRLHPKVAFSGQLLSRIIGKVDQVLPIHIEILLVGFLEEIDEVVKATEAYSMAWTLIPSESVHVVEVFIGTPIGVVPVSLLTEATKVAQPLVIRTPGRYDIGCRYNGTVPDPSVSPTDLGSSGPPIGLLRCDIGKVLHSGV